MPMQTYSQSVTPKIFDMLLHRDADAAADEFMLVLSQAKKRVFGGDLARVKQTFTEVFHAKYEDHRHWVMNADNPTLERGDAWQITNTIELLERGLVQLSIEPMQAARLLGEYFGHLFATLELIVYHSSAKATIISLIDASAEVFKRYHVRLDKQALISHFREMVDFDNAQLEKTEVYRPRDVIVAERQSTYTTIAPHLAKLC